MGRYHPTKKKKSGNLLNVLAIIVGMIIAASWIYFNDIKTAGLIETKTQPLPLPAIDLDLERSESNQFMPTDELAVKRNDELIDDAQEIPIVLPKLEDSDQLVNEELLKLSPGLLPWLDTDQLIRKSLEIVNDFSQESRLAKHMSFFKPRQPFGIDQDSDGMFIAESSYHRYDELAAAINALDVNAAIAFYKKIRPLLLQVYSGFSYPEGYRLEHLFLKAGAEILAAPVKTGRIALIRPSVYYKFADPKIEALNPVRKQMLRLGPRNTLIIQNKVRKLVEALAEYSE